MGVIVELPQRLTASDAARALEHEPGLVVLATSGAAGPSFVAVRPVERSTAWVPDVGAPEVGWAGGRAAPRWVGVIPYEAGRDLEREPWCEPDRRPAVRDASPEWLRYEAVLRVDGRTGAAVIEADHAGAAAELRARLLEGASRPRDRGFSLTPAATEDPELHVERVRRALELIARGEIYQVNLARFLGFRVAGSRAELFAQMFASSPVKYGFYGQFFGGTVCGASPELALSVRGRRATTGPIKGTRARGADALADEALARDLDGDPKERAELTMAIDLHRNDLGRVAVPGTVVVPSAPRIERGARVMSRVAEVSALLRRDVSLAEVARAILPVGSVTGAPKVRAMEIIRGLEPERRGLYTGAYGYVGRDGALELAVAIRTLFVAEDGAARYGAGGGIVEASDPRRELEETRWKAAHLGGLAPPARSR